MTSLLTVREIVIVIYTSTLTNRPCKKYLYIHYYNEYQYNFLTLINF